MNDLISRQSVIDALEQGFKDATNGLNKFSPTRELIKAVTGIYKCYIEQLPTIQSKIVRCKDCKYWHSGSCEYPEHAVNSQDYYVGDIETEAEHFCGYAERKEETI